MKIATFTFNLFEENTYIAFDPASREGAIIDPGMASEADCRKIERYVDDNGLRLTHMLFTHLHIDHTLGAEWVERRYGLGVEANRADEFLGERRLQQADMFRLPVHVGPLVVKNELAEGQKIAFGDDCLEVLEIPGHSPGSVVFYNRRGGWVATGDVLFEGSIGRTDLPGGNHAALVGGIRKKLLTLPPDTVVYPGHGLPTTIGAEAVGNPFI